MEFLYTGTENLDVQLTYRNGGQPFRITIEPSGLPQRTSNKRLFEYLFSKENPNRDLFFIPGQEPKPPAVDSKKAKKKEEVE